MLRAYLGCQPQTRQSFARLALSLSVSLTALSFATGAAAQCTPDPLPNGGTVTCSGDDPDGVTVTADNVTVNVTEGATVTEVVSAPVALPFSAVTNHRINIVGQVGNRLVLTGASSSSALPGFPPPARYDIVVSPGGRIDGQGIVLALPNSATPPAPGRFAINLNLTNAGTIAAQLDGTAISGTPFATVSVDNTRTGVMGRIVTDLLSLRNAGAIQGGAHSAIDIQTVASQSFQAQRYINNIVDGRIQNSASASTIRFLSGSLSGGFVLENSGLVANSGDGEAVTILSTPGGPAINSINNSGTISAGGITIRATGTLSIFNQGIIISDSGLAIQPGASLRLTNIGRINGSVVANASPVQLPFQQSFVELRRGSIITGNLTFGSADDELVIDGLSVSPLVTGMVDGGGGTNLIRFRLERAEYNFTSLPLLPTNFQRSAFVLEGGTVLNWRASGTLTAPITLVNSVNFSSEPAQFTNFANIDAIGPALTAQSFASGYGIDVINRGVIRATLTNPDSAAIKLAGNETSFTNFGTVSAVGGNGVIGEYLSGLITNRGLITATGTAASGTINNSGVIISTNGTGAISGALNNRGLITGRNAGVMLALSGGDLTNSSLISSLNIGVLIGYTGFIDNQADGIIIGGQNAIAMGPNSFLGFETRIRNAGRIVGDVDLRRGVGEASGNLVYLRRGSALIGNLILGDGGDTLFVDYDAPGRLGGVTGLISGGPATALNHMVREDGGFVLSRLASLPDVFTVVGFSLLGDRNFTLTGSATTDRTIRFSGAGSVTSTANLSGNGSRDLIDVSNIAFSNDPLIPTIEVVSATRFVNRGTLNVLRNGEALSSATVIRVAALGIGFDQDNQVVNEGTINALDLTGAGRTEALAAIAGNARIVNRGSIRVAGSIGIFSTSNPEAASRNEGTISQITGGPDATGVWAVYGFLNSGTVNVGGTAALLGDEFFQTDAVFTNSGVLQSQNGAAVVTLTSSYGHEFFNLAGGVIRGVAGGDAVRYDGIGLLANAGTIIGNVSLLGISVFGDNGGSRYISNGGTLRGNLIFGAGNDGLVLNGGTITGTVDGGDGRNALGVVVAQLPNGRLDLLRYTNFTDVSLLGPGAVSFSRIQDIDWLYIEGSDFTLRAGQILTVRPPVDEQFQSGVLQFGGRMTIDGRLSAGTFNIESGILSGRGRIETSILRLGAAGPAFVTPGGDGTIGTLTVDGAVEAYGTTSLIVDVNGTAVDQLRVIPTISGLGTIQLDGALHMNAVGTGPRFGRNYTIITATNGVNGTFTEVTGAVGVLTPVATYNPTNVVVRYNAGSLAAALPVGASRVETAFATALDSLRTSNYTSLSTLYGLIDIVTPSARGIILSTLNPAMAGAADRMTMRFGGEMFDMIAGRASALGTFAAPAGTLSFFGAPDAAGLRRADAGTLSAAQQRSAIVGYGVSGHHGGQLPVHVSGFVSGGIDASRDSALGAHERGQRRDWHIAMGLEIEQPGGLVTGTAFAHRVGRTAYRSGDAQVSLSQMAVYANYAPGANIYLSGLVAATFSETALGRSSFDGQSLVALSGSARSVSYGAQIEVGYRIPVTSTITLTPYSALRISDAGLNNYREQGGESALRIDGVDRSEVTSRIGLRFGGSTALGDGWMLRPELEASWSDTVAGGDSLARVRFANAPSFAFALPFSTATRNQLDIGAAVNLTRGTLSLAGGLSANSSAYGERERRGSIRLSWQF